jgi:hypothetical protein
VCFWGHMTMAGTLVRLGWSDPLTDTFGIHPLLGAVLDLNDGQTYTLLSPQGLNLSAPARTLVSAGNIRTRGCLWHFCSQLQLLLPMHCSRIGTLAIHSLQPSTASHQMGLVSTRSPTMAHKRWSWCCRSSCSPTP